MGRLVEPVGQYAETPYVVPGPEKRVFCVEELCYVFEHDAFMLDRELVDSKLAAWLDEKCGLRDLALDLQKLIRQNGSPSSLAGIILDYVGYKTADRRKEIENLLRKSADMDELSKKKNHADYLVRSGKIVQAISEYDELIRSVQGLDHVSRSDLYHNMGVALCRMFDFEEAENVFFKALEENPDNQQAQYHYLACKKMRMTREEYLSWVGSREAWYDISLQLERNDEQIREAYERSTGKIAFRALIGSGSGRGRSGEYYDRMSDKLLELKQEYREMIDRV